MFYSQQSILW